MSDSSSGSDVALFFVRVASSPFAGGVESVRHALGLDDPALFSRAAVLWTGDQASWCAFARVSGAAAGALEALLTSSLPGVTVRVASLTDGRDEIFRHAERFPEEPWRWDSRLEAELAADSAGLA